MKRYFFRDYPFSLSGKDDAVDVWVPIHQTHGAEGELALGVIDWLHSPRLVNRAAQLLAGKLAGRNFDLLLTIETQSIPLIHVLSSTLSALLDREVPYLICRRDIKPYMVDPIIEPYRPALSQKEQLAVLDGYLAQRLKGKRVVLVDVAVISGQTIQVLERIAKRAGGEVVCRAVVVARGDYPDELVALRTVPLLQWAEERGAWMEIPAGDDPAG